MNTHFDDLRTIAPGPGGVADRQIDIKAAMDRWKAANACAGTACRRMSPALIVASEGGASRAAFMMATVVGELIDRAKAAGDPADAANRATVGFLRFPASQAGRLLRQSRAPLSPTPLKSRPMPRHVFSLIGNMVRRGRQNPARS